MKGSFKHICRWVSSLKANRPTIPDEAVPSGPTFYMLRGWDRRFRPTVSQAIMHETELESVGHSEIFPYNTESTPDYVTDIYKLISAYTN